MDDPVVDTHVAMPDTLKEGFALPALPQAAPAAPPPRPKAYDEDDDEEEEGEEDHVPEDAGAEDADSADPLRRGGEGRRQARSRHCAEPGVAKGGGKLDGKFRVETMGRSRTALSPGWRRAAASSFKALR
jgi:hypothetical protein